MKSIQKKMPFTRQQGLSATLICLVLLSFTFISATKRAEKGSHEPNNWVHDKTVSSVDCFHQLTNCNGKPAVMLKFNNRSRGSVKITWGEIYTSVSGEMKQGFGGRKELILRPGVNAPVDCNDQAAKQMITKNSEVDPMMIIDIKDFSFDRIEVSPVIRINRN